MMMNQVVVALVECMRKVRMCALNDWITSLLSLEIPPYLS